MRPAATDSLEVRCPLLDHKLLELVAQMPSGLKLCNGTGKYIFKRSLERVLPAEILTRAKKGFAVPVTEGPTASLIQKALPPLEAQKSVSGDKQMRIKYIKRTDCVEVGKDHFDEVVSKVLTGHDLAAVVSPAAGPAPIVPAGLSGAP